MSTDQDCVKVVKFYAALEQVDSGLEAVLDALKKERKSLCESAKSVGQELGGPLGAIDEAKIDESWSGEYASLILQDIETLQPSIQGEKYPDPAYSQNSGKLAIDPAFISQIISSLAKQNGSRVTFHDSRKDGCKPPPRNDMQFLSMFAPSFESFPARNVMQLVLEEPHGPWARVPLASILDDKHGAREAFIGGLERRIRAAHCADGDDDVRVLAVESGSVIVTYRCWSRRRPTGGPRKVALPDDVAAAFRAEFGAAYRTLRVHPAYFLNVDMAALDPGPKASKYFPPPPRKRPRNPAADFQVSPPTGPPRYYRQPLGWTRTGLRVRGKYGDDAWLEPFDDDNRGLWLRAYHGTVGDAFGAIVSGGFHPSGGPSLKMGPGVYVSPHPAYADRYGAEHEVRFADGLRRRFRCILQCAVRPDAVVREGYPACADYPGEKSEWLLADPAAVRPYGILFKEVTRGGGGPANLNPAAAVARAAHPPASGLSGQGSPGGPQPTCAQPAAAATAAGPGSIRTRAGLRRLGGAAGGPPPP